MFESIRHWMDSLTEESRLFRHADDELVHSALASLLFHFIAVDERHDGREKREFERILQQEFALAREQTDHLYQAARAASNDFQDDLRTLNEYLKDNPAARLMFMQKLLKLMSIHGTQSEELDLFYATLREIFPEIRNPIESDLI